MKFNKQIEVTSSINEVGSLSDVSELLSQCLEEKVIVEGVIPSPFEDALCFKAQNKKIILMASYNPDASIRHDAFKNLLDFSDMQKKPGPVILVLFNLKGKTGYGRRMQKMTTYDDNHLIDDTKAIEICVQYYVEKFLKGDKKVAQKYPNILSLELGASKMLNEDIDISKIETFYNKLEHMKKDSSDKEFYKRLINGLLQKGITPMEIKDLTGLSLKEIEKYHNMIK